MNYVSSIKNPGETPGCRIFPRGFPVPRGKIYSGVLQSLATSFSTRWNAYRAKWKKLVTNRNSNSNQEQKNDLNEDQALFEHYKTNHPRTLVEINYELSKAYKIIFIEKPRKDNLDVAENYWIAKLKSKINIKRSNFPICN